MNRRNSFYPDYTDADDELLDNVYINEFDDIEDYDRYYLDEINDYEQPKSNREIKLDCFYFIAYIYRFEALVFHHLEW